MQREHVVTHPTEAELRALYELLAAHWQWPMPETWDEDRETILSDPDAALTCLRNLVVDLPPPAPVPLPPLPTIADLRRRLDAPRDPSRFIARRKTVRYEEIEVEPRTGQKSLSPDMAKQIAAKYNLAWSPATPRAAAKCTRCAGEGCAWCGKGAKR